MTSPRFVSERDIKGPNLIPCETEDGEIMIDLEWTVPVPPRMFLEKIASDDTVTILRRMTVDESKDWIATMSAQLGQVTD